MIGLVFVSHSAKLAEGVLELAAQMTRGAVPMEACGGIDDPDNPIGTDPMRVLAAIESVAGRAEDGVLVLMDLGSALMSAETALDFLPDEVRAKVLLCAAPLVEGAVAAAVQASVGASLAQAGDEARLALGAKVAQLAPLTGEATGQADAPAPDSVLTQANATAQADATTPDGAAVPGGATVPQGAEASGPTGPEQAPGQAGPAVAPDSGDAADQSVTLDLVVANRLGLHARPAANLVTTAGKFRAEVTVRKGQASASAKSLNQIALLAVKRGDAITLTITGPQARQAAQALAALHADNFGEPGEDAAPQATPQSGQDSTGEAGVLAGQPASPGYAVGPAHVHRAGAVEVVRRQTADPAGELARLDQALDQALAELDELGRRTRRASGQAEAAIFEVHRLLLGDQDIREQTRSYILAEKVNAEYAWSRIMEQTAQAYRALEDDYMRARAADVSDCAERVLRLLAGAAVRAVRLERPSILLARDLAPSEVAGLDPALVLGLATQVGGATSHAAILARSLGIPAVTGAGEGLEAVGEGQIVALDGFTGTVWPTPDRSAQEAAAAKREAWLAGRQRARSRGGEPALTRDGRRVPVFANIGGPAEARRARELGAEGVGLFRTEFLFQDRDQAPDEQEQYEAYLEAARALEGDPVVIRTLDVGGDKPIAYLDMAREANPFLGERGVRFCMARPALFRTQLRALLRAAGRENVRILYPMVSDAAELAEVLAFQARVREELAAEGHDVARKVETGIMIEVPSAVTMAERLAGLCDFFSIGTNDLTQYVMAADRGNAAVSALCDSLHPAVLRMIGATCQAAGAGGIEVALCGELAGNVKAAPLLLGLGVGELSMNGPAIGEVKQAIRSVSLAECRVLAAKALDAANAAQVRALLG